MNITITQSEAEFDTLAAWRVIAAILNKPKVVIGLSTGQTTAHMHRIISEIYSRHPFDTSGVTLFGVDEITRVSREYAGSCYSMLRNQLVDALQLSEAQFLMPSPFSDDFEKECRAYEDELEKRGGIDLQVLGLGTNGHLGFNQPGTPFGSRTWISKMDPALESRVRRETNSSPDKEMGGFTLGITNIMQARKILLVCKGPHKAEIVRKMLLDPVTEDIPASVLQLHPDCEFLLDTAAAKYIN